MDQMLVGYPDFVYNCSKLFKGMAYLVEFPRHLHGPDVSYPDFVYNCSKLFKGMAYLV